MTALAYYNEIDPFAAQWLRNLIDAGHIAPGIVDTRSIEDVTPNDLKGFTQCHFFAGIGVWSYALRLLGWPDDKPIWTGSCPCQPFSASGKGKGFADERHLWPAFHWLIGQCRPVIVAGEQSASRKAYDWVDLVQTDLESVGYAFGAVAFPSAGVSAPHLRDRTYWVAHPNSEFMEASGEPGTGGRIEFANGCKLIGVDYADSERRNAGRNRNNAGNVRQQSGPISQVGRVANPDSIGWKGRLSGWQDSQRKAVNGSIGCGGTTCGLADAESQGLPRRGRGPALAITPEIGREVSAANGMPLNGCWGNADWLFCQDGKWRAIESGVEPLANGVAGRVGQLRAYGNAINPHAAAAFLSAYIASGATA
ncbi:DNA cytosine methyltransferase [Salmonella enterica]|nr:DNA cytosine methyltransferase [Salmonella enterica]EBI9231601.1 DNA cytosine methyltransferase [Salmonella enterica]